jgi:DnaK suppressor protein
VKQKGLGAPVAKKSGNRKPAATVAMSKSTKNAKPAPAKPTRAKPSPAKSIPTSSKKAAAPAAAPVKKVAKPALVVSKATSKGKVVPPAAKTAVAKAAPAKPLPAKPVPAKPAPVVAAPTKAAPAVAKPVVAAAFPSKVFAKPLRPVKLAKKKLSSLKPRPDDTPVRLPPKPVTSDSKMQKNRAGLSSKELEHFRDLLLEKRRELLGDVSSMEREALRSGNTNLSNLPLHMADTGTDNYEQEFTLGLVEKDRQLLREIQVALAKIQDGSYGVCEGTGKPIAKPRLEAYPWAKYSIEHARALEKPQFRRY